MSNIITDEGLLKYVNADHALHYVNQIFKNVIDFDPAWMVEVRKFGQYRAIDGTSSPAEQSVAAQLLQFDQANPIPGLAQWVVDKIVKAAPIGIGTFMAPALLNDRRANDQSVVRMLTVCADFDTGHPTQLLEHAISRIGVRPTIIATSGGITPEGHAKLHAHWRLDEPCDEPWKVAYIREQLAKQFGADQSFKRIPQIIRIPGALYDKKGAWSTTLITEFNDHDIGIHAWEELLGIDWNNLAEDSIFNRTSTKSREEKADRLHALHTEEVTEGRTTDTRWDRFSEYAGHQIKQARFGHQSVEEAFKSVSFWVNDKMVPPWDPQRVDAEFKALLQRDRVNHELAWSERDKPAITFLQNGPTPVSAKTQPPEGEVWSLLNFSGKRLYPAGKAPPERHLIQDFLVHGSSVALVADGGVGKTYLSLELAMRASAGPDYSNNLFLGFKILEKMLAVVFTVEDGQHDIHRRLDAIDMDGSLRKAAGDNFIVVPVQEQISDGLVLVEKDKKGNFAPSAAWRGMQTFIEQYIEQMKLANQEDLPLLVIIDTYSATHHGDENSAIGTNEWFRAVGLLRKFEATLFLTHHIRKSDPKMEIKTPADMKAAVRGSSAFLNNVRTCYGIWEMPNSDAVIKEIRQVVEMGTRLFNMGILKNNTGISWTERSSPKFLDPMITLKRLGSGRLVFDGIAHQKRLELGEGKKERMDASRAQLRAAIIHAVRWYGEQSWPLSERNLTKDKDQFLPTQLKGMSREKEIIPLLKELLANGVLKQVSIKGRNGGTILDVPEGAYAAGTQTERRSDTPAMQWSHFKYDEENEEYLALQNVQHIIDV